MKIKYVLSVGTVFLLLFSFLSFVSAQQAGDQTKYTLSSCSDTDGDETSVHRRASFV